MRNILVVLISLLSALSFSQEVTVIGRCVDKVGAPVYDVQVYSEDALGISRTDVDGEYSLVFTKVESVTIIYRLTGEMEDKKRIIQLHEGENKLDDLLIPIQQQDGVTVRRYADPFKLPKLAPVDFQLLALGSPEKYLVLTTAATSNNELTTNYNVRGGSYDENLVYVNGFQIYRPFLTRSGQQEGMSFINSALVKDLRFSGGGFDSQYGDKLSSVLDIEYRRPDSLRASLSASLLGVESHIEDRLGARFDYLIGARYRSNGYLLNSLPTQGAYNPVFWDAQFLTNFAVTEKVNWSLLGHFSSNNYRFQPQSQRTDFGTANEAYSFVVYFGGQEQTRFQTMTGGTSIKWEVTEKTNLDFYATVFNTDEREYFDIEAEYFINQLESDPSQEAFGDSIATLGIGSYMTHARNRLNATISSVYHRGDHIFSAGFKDADSLLLRKHQLKWGADFQVNDFYDVLSEWKVVDSAGFAQTESTDENLVLTETIKGQLNLRAQRYTSFLQMNSTWSNNKKNSVVSITKKVKLPDGPKIDSIYSDTIYQSLSKWNLSYGVRSGYTTSNSEFYITPRASVTFSPRAYMVHRGKVKRRSVNYRLAAGMYYQPPFYREFRTFEGDLNLDVKAQKSVHIVTGTDVYFSMWNRESPFKFTAEAYYKYLWDVNTYEIENVRTRYYANNDAVAYAYGLDLNLHGEFVEGIETFFKAGFLSTKEDVLGDYYYDYLNAAGEKIVFGISEDQTVVDSNRVEPGFIPRPTDQMFNFGALIQDRMPKYESFSVQVGIQYGTPLPYGPPDFARYKDTLRLRSYFRVDIGMSYDFLYNKKKRDREREASKGELSPEERELKMPQKKETFWTKNFEDAIISFEVFNLLGVRNVLSKQWIQDVEGRFYAIPNYLTARRFNLKLILRF
ncbi:MAG: hypothetical protein P8P87_06095 [Crocinitomicaceae bacterium]|nr:hypothetical protein [Crocinitomicaceae bacterium]